MPTEAQSKAISTAISSIRSAEDSLLDQGRQTTDPLVTTKISNEYSALDSVLTQLSHAQAIADDGLFQKAAAALQQEAVRLGAQAKAISGIIDDVGVAGKIAGYIAQAATALASL